MRLLLAVAGAAAARAALAGLRGAPWSRTNFRGQQVSLAGGPAFAVAASLTAAAGAPTRPAAAAALTAGLGAATAGLYDDLVAARPEHQAKGFHGHLAALRHGRITSGMVKIIGIGAASLVAATALGPPPRRPPPRGLPSRRPPLRRLPSRRSWTFPGVSPGVSRRNSMIAGMGEVLLGAGVIAGAANLTNLLDLRPGRALKVGLLVGAPMTTGPSGGLAAGPVGAAAGLLGEDLAERSMLGDCGANALGALLGTALVARTGPAGRAAALALIAALTATSERVSFTQVIARTPGLRELDELGRRTAAAGPSQRRRGPERRQ